MSDEHDADTAASTETEPDERPDESPEESTDESTDDSADETSDETSDSGDSDDSPRLTKEQAMGQEDVPEDKQQAIEEEREKRLDPDNRPENAEVDNSDRDFDVKSGQFTDHETDEEIGPYNDPSAEDGEDEA